MPARCKDISMTMWIIVSHLAPGACTGSGIVEGEKVGIRDEVKGRIVPVDTLFPRGLVVLFSEPLAATGLSEGGAISLTLICEFDRYVSFEEETATNVADCRLSPALVYGTFAAIPYATARSPTDRNRPLLETITFSSFLKIPHWRLQNLRECAFVVLRLVRSYAYRWMLELV